MTPPDPSRILVVDDHRTTRQSLCLLLRDVGYVCSTAEGVAEARAVLWSGVIPPALIVVDLWMPHEDGEALLRWVKLQPHLRQTRVVIYTAAPEQDHRRRLIEAGADDFIPKPTPIPEILARLSKFARANRVGMTEVMSEIGQTEGERAQ